MHPNLVELQHIAPVGTTDGTEIAVDYGDNTNSVIITPQAHASNGWGCMDNDDNTYAYIEQARSGILINFNVPVFLIRLLI